MGRLGRTIWRNTWRKANLENKVPVSWREWRKRFQLRRCDACEKVKMRGTLTKVGSLLLCHRCERKASPRLSRSPV